jgi:flagellar hook-basal body complex protein FliE
LDIRTAFQSPAIQPARPASLPPTGTPPSGPGAGSAAASFLETLRAAETTALGGMTGKADAMSVVEALASTELAVETAVAVRDKVVEAYQEILRMPV